LSDDSRHNFAVLSREPVAKRDNVWWNATDKTQSLCSVRVATQIAVKRQPFGEKRHNFAVLSLEPVTKMEAVG
jgi:hypothetical protein